MKMKKARRLISILMLLTIMVSVPATSVHAEGNVGRVVQGKVGTISQAYTDGNSQVYANLITKADGTEVRYVYSKNYLCSNSPEDTFAALKSVLTADYAALIPDSVDTSLNGSVGFFFCSDPSLEQYVNDNWTSAEYVAKNFLTVKKEGMSNTYKSEKGVAVNTSATAARKNNRFEWIKTLAEAGYIARWEAIEEERKAAWDAAEAEKQEEDLNYIPQQYQPSTYVPLDFGDLTDNDIQGTRDLTSSQIDLAVGCNLTTGYSFEQGGLVELINIEIIDHVASVYSDHAIISESSSDDEKEAQEATVKEDPKPKSVTYNGSAQELVTAGTAEGGTMQYALGTNATTAPTTGYTTSIPTATNAGTYYVWYKAVGDDNHTESDVACVTVTIAEKKDDSDTVAKPEYKNTSGAGSSWTNGSTGTLDFTFKRTENDETTYDHFIGVKVDEKTIDAANYDKEKGSVIIKLKSAFLDTLAAGEHTLTAVFDDGDDVTVKFTIAAKADEKKADVETKITEAKKAETNKTASPQTGDNSNIPLAFMLILDSGMGAVYLTIRRRMEK